MLCIYLGAVALEPHMALKFFQVDRPELHYIRQILICYSMNTILWEVTYCDPEGRNGKVLKQERAGRRVVSWMSSKRRGRSLANSYTTLPAHKSSRFVAI
jgi:hypothetical protein